MKKRIIIIAISVVSIIVIFFAVQYLSFVHQISLSKQFPISIEEGEVIDYNAVNVERL